MGNVQANLRWQTLPLDHLHGTTQLPCICEC